MNSHDGLWQIEHRVLARVLTFMEFANGVSLVNWTIEIGHMNQNDYYYYYYLNQM